MVRNRRFRRFVDFASEVLDGVDGFEHRLHDLTSAGALRLVRETTLEQLGVGQNDPKLIVQPVKQARPFRLRQAHKSATGTSTGSSGARSQPLTPGLAIVGTRFAPQRVSKDPDGPAGGSDVLNLAAGDPVIDSAPAHANQLARSGNRHGLAVQDHDFLLAPNYRRPERETLRASRVKIPSLQ